MLKKIIISIAILLVLIMVLYPFLLSGMASYLVVSDKPQKADVILVLSGDDNGERVSHAVDLYKQGYAPKMVMSGGPLAWRLTQADNMKRQAKYLGVPASAIYLEDKSRSTMQNIQFSLPIIKKLNAKTLILVTSPYHSRRAYLTADKYFKNEGIKVISSPVIISEFNPNKWWTRHEDTQCVVWEYVSFVLYALKGQLF